MWESLAINRYVIGRYRPELLGADDAVRALTHQWSTWSQVQFLPPVVRLFIQLVFVPDDALTARLDSRARCREALACGTGVPSPSGGCMRLVAPEGVTLRDVDTVSTAHYPQDLVMIEAIVGEGQGGWGGRDGAYRVHCIPVDAWRRLGEPIQRERMSVLRPIGAHAEMFGVVEEGDFLRLEVLLSDDGRRAVMAWAETIDGDEELRAALEASRIPVVHRSERFGELVRDRRFGTYNVDTTWNDSPVRLTLEPEESLDEPLAAAEVLWAGQVLWKARIDAYAVRELLPLKNDTWLGDEEEPFTAEQFVARMTLRTITVGARGDFAFWHDDGNLFWGHAIMIAGNLTDGPNDADIPG